MGGRGGAGRKDATLMSGRGARAPGAPGDAPGAPTGAPLGEIVGATGSPWRRAWRSVWRRVWRRPPGALAAAVLAGLLAGALALSLAFPVSLWAQEETTGLPDYEPTPAEVAEGEKSLATLEAQQDKVEGLEEAHADAYAAASDSFAGSPEEAAEREAAEAVQDAADEREDTEEDLLLAAEPRATAEQRVDYFEGEKEWVDERQSEVDIDFDAGSQYAAAYVGEGAFPADYDEVLDARTADVDAALADARADAEEIEALRRADEEEAAAEQAEESAAAGGADGGNPPDGSDPYDGGGGSDGEPAAPPVDSGGGIGVNPLTFVLFVLFAAGVFAALVLPRLKRLPGSGGVAGAWARYMKSARATVAPTGGSGNRAGGDERPTLGAWRDEPLARPDGPKPKPPTPSTPPTGGPTGSPTGSSPEDVFGTPTGGAHKDAPPPTPPVAPPSAPPVKPPSAPPGGKPPGGGSPAPVGATPRTPPGGGAPTAAPARSPKLSPEEKKVLLGLGDALKERVIGQDHAAVALGDSMLTQRVGRFGGDRPESFLFCGTTGVGKTEISKALADELFGGEGAMVRIDMSEYADKHQANRFAGAPPGYVGYEEGGQLTNAMMEDGRRVVLLDEIEKAHPDVLNNLLQILDDGRLTTGKGETVDFKDAVVIMTSNAGAQEIRVRFEAAARRRTGGAGGVEDAGIPEREMKEILVAGGMKPELVNRVGEIITFRPLTAEDVRKITRLMLKGTAKKLGVEHGVGLDVSDGAVAWIAREGFEPENGARPLRGVIRKHVENPVSKALARDEVGGGDRVLLGVERGEDGEERLTIGTKPKPTREPTREPGKKKPGGGKPVGEEPDAAPGGAPPAGAPDGAPPGGSSGDPHGDLFDLFGDPDDPDGGTGGDPGGRG